MNTSLLGNVMHTLLSQIWGEKCKGKIKYFIAFLNFIACLNEKLENVKAK